MTRASALAACEATVRRADPDRYFATLFAPAGKRPALYALYAFNHELARAGEIARDPLAAEIRLQWWREVLGAAREGRPPAHPVAIGLVEILSSNVAHAADLEALVEARVIEASAAPFPTLAAMECHAQATSARLMQMAAYATAGMCGPAGAIDEAGIAYGLTGMLRSFHAHALRGKIFLPTDLVASEGLSNADVGHANNAAKLKRVFDHVKTRAMDHFRRATQHVLPRAVISAVLPASLVPMYLSQLVRNAHPFRDGTHALRLRRQLTMLRAAVLGRL